MNIQRRRKQKKYYYIGLFLCLALLTYYYIGGEGIKESKEVFSYSDIYTDMDEHSMNNIFIFIFNNSIPALKAVYENHTGINVGGIDGFIYGGIASLPVKFFNNPLNALKQSYWGFAEINERDLNSPEVMENKELDIKSFSDVPEGDIYFSEEYEYKIEDSNEHYVAESDNHKSLNKANTGENDSNIPSPDKINIEKNNPIMLIYHSHATESYMPNTASNYHTLLEKYNVVSVGSIMAKVLENKYNFKVIHDKTYHDKESYAYSYSNSQKTIKSQMAKYPSIKVLIDIHRDAFVSQNEREKIAKKNDYTAVINGKKAARVMLVIGKKNPNFSELEKFAACIQEKMDKLYPGLFFRTETPNAKYNQYFSEYSVLLEVGCMLNTIEEANYTAELMGNVLGEVLKELQE